MFEHDLPEQHQILRSTVSKFADKEVVPLVTNDERTRRFQHEIVVQMGKLGFLGCPLPETYGGNGMGFLAHVIVSEEIGRASCSLGVCLNTQTMGTARTIYDWGSDQQKSKYISKLISAELIGCLAISEPDAGSDVAAMKTKAMASGDHYILNGTKTWISYAPVADVALVFAYTQPELKHHGISAFIVDMHASGIAVSPDLEKMGWRSAPSSEIYFDNVQVTAENLVGRPGQGFEIMMSCLDNIRLTSAARAVGNCQALIDEAIKYARQRRQFGKPIGQFQMVQETVARMVTDTEAARLLTYRAASERDKGVLNNTREISIAKYFASEAAARIADEAFKIMGAYGCAGQYPIGRLLRDAKMHLILDGSSNIQKMIIGTDAIGIRRANR